MEPNEAVVGGYRPATIAGKPRGRIAFAAALVVVIAIVAAFAAVLLEQQGALMPPQQTGPAATRDWRVYHDPLNLFTMRLPPGWTASSSLGSFTEGNRTESMSGQEENIQFSNPSLGAASPRILVFAQQMNSQSLAQSMWCSEYRGQPSTFNGYPADESSPAEILFDSANAHFQIGETIPGSLAPANPGGPANPPPPPTPLPTATVMADRSLLSDALATFQPTNPHALSCP